MMGWRLGNRLGSRHAVGKAKMTDETERDPDKLMQWQIVDWIHLLDMARGISF